MISLAVFSCKIIGVWQWCRWLLWGWGVGGGLSLLSSGTAGSGNVDSPSSVHFMERGSFFIASWKMVWN